MTQPPIAHARLAAWAAINLADPAGLGSMTLDEDCWLWGHEGSFLLTAGTHRLDSLAELAGDRQDFAVPDPWGDSFSLRDELGDLTAAAWWTVEPLDKTAEADLTRDLRSLLAAQHALGELVPAAAEWVAGATSVVVPLASPPSSMFRSGTVAGLPGLVLVEVTDKPLLTLEALVHETAHLYFHLADAGAPLLVEGHTRLYHSPLRVDRRPLRGIFLALHALVHMCGFYEDWRRVTDDPRCTEALDDLRRSRDEAADTLTDAGDGLTDAGDAFLSRCLDLVDRQPVR